MGLTQEEARAEAVRRIAHARDTGAEVLDLGDLGLEALPEEIRELRDLRVLALGAQRPVMKDGKWEWEEVRFRSSRLADVSALAALTSLTHLNMFQCYAVSDLAPLAELTSLSTLDLYNCMTSDVSPLAALTGLTALNLGWCRDVSDVSPLSNLANLTTLNLRRCRDVSDVSPLGNLANLTTLSLAQCSVSDVSPLGNLVNLNNLNLFQCPVSDATPLANLVNLTHLNLGECAVPDVKPLTGLRSLTNLELHRCAVSDVSPLATLTNLNTLDLRWCQEISNVYPLSNLVNLITLNLSGCEVSDVSPLAALTNLTTLALIECPVSNIAPLASLVNLTTLELGSCREVSDVSLLGNLTKLTTLDLHNCAVSDVTMLAALTRLNRLNLSGCSKVTSFRSLRTLLPQLRELILTGCGFSDLPASVCGSYYSENVIHEVRAYYADLDAGAEADAEVKLFVLGNGHVGKTQLVRRLRKQPYDATVPTTHGVEWHSFPVEAEAADGSALPVSVNLWDFGGQDIYHGSHALFLDRHAVFVVLWHPDFESGTTVEHGTTMTNHPLAYWLDYVRAAAGPDAVVLLVQARADTRHDEHPLPDIDTGDLTVRHAVFSAKTGNGFRGLRGQIEDAVRDLIGARPPQLIGRGRLAVRNRLRAMLAEDQKRPKAERRHRLLTEAEFRTICDEEGGVSSAAALLTFLHRTGVVFHNPGLFGGQIVLDQQWALDAIYTLLDRARAVPLLRALHGRFTRAEIEGAVWGEYTPDEQQTFLGMMRECDICFESGERNRETLYTAPELLPDEGIVLGALAGLLPEGEAPVSATARFRFLHDGIVRGLLAGVGRVAGEKGHYWRTGCYFFDEATRSRILVDVLREPANEAEPASGTIRFRGWGPDPAPVLDALVRELDRVRGRQEPHIERLWSPSQERRAPDAEPRANPLSVLRPGPLPAGDRVAAISYGHGDELDENGRRRGAFVDGLEAAMKDWNYGVIRDINELQNCGQIRAFVPTICATRRIVLVLTDKYLRSVPCMTELHAVFVEARQRRDTFASLVVPCVLEDLPGLGFADDEGRVAWRAHWEREYERRAAHVRKYGRDDLNQWYDIGQWAHLVPDMLAFVANMVADRGYDALTANGFAAVKRMLDRPRPGG